MSSSLLPDLTAKLTGCRLAPLAGGDVRSLVADPQQPDRIYLGTQTGQVYVSTDGGQLWTRLVGLSAPSDWVVDDLLVDPTHSEVLYAGMWSVRNAGGGVFRSRDGGRSWTELEGLKGQAVRALALAPSHPRLLVAGTLEGVFRSEDGGDHWQRISPLGHAEIHHIESVAMDPRDPGILYVGTWHLPWKTTDGGLHWTSIKEGMIDDSDIFSLIVDPHSPQRLYAGACTGIYRSDNAGATWKKIQGIPESSRRTHTLAVDLQDPETLYVGTTQGLWKTTDRGQSWKRLTQHTWVINAIVLDSRDPQHLFLGVDDAGVMESQDGGRTFRAANHGFAQRQVSRIVSDPTEKGRIYAALLHDGEFGGVFTTINGGASWQQLSTGLEGKDVLSLLVVTRPAWKLLAGTLDGLFEYPAEQSGWKNRSRWEIPGNKTSATLPGLKVWDLYQRRADEPIYAATSAGLFASADGSSWRQLGAGSLQEGVYTVATFGDRGEALLAATGGVLKISRDGGQNWSPVLLNGDGPVRARKLTTHPAFPSVAFVGTDAGLFRSTDGGQSWQRFGRGLPVSPVHEIIFSPENPLYLIVASIAGVFHSADGGNQYARMGNGEGPQQLPVQLLAFHPAESLQILAASAQNGLFLRNGSEMILSHLQPPAK